MKKSYILFFILLFLFGCGGYNNEEIESYNKLDEIISDSNGNGFFIDVRDNETFVKGFISHIFDNVSSIDDLKDYISKNNINDKDLIVIYGQNESDSNLDLIYNYLIGEGFKNIKKYSKGYDDYSLKEGFIPKTPKQSSGDTCDKEKAC